MMQNELIDDDALLPPRVVVGTFSPELPDGCTWRLLVDDKLVTSGRVNPDQKVKLAVSARCKADSKLTLRVQLPPFVGLVCSAPEMEGGLVILDTVDIAITVPGRKKGIVSLSKSPKKTA